jgi:hypothetical protein
MSGGRQHFRIKDNFSVRWSIKDGISGEGIVLDISTNGIKLITDKSFDPPDECVLNIESSTGGQLPFGTKKAVIKWFQKVMKGKVECIVCGLEFI